MTPQLPPIREVIKAHGLSARRSLGQNFILDLNVTGRIARLAGDLSNLTVVEIGPGPGGLTRALLEHGAKQVVAVERDQRCLAALDEIAQFYPGRLIVRHEDALSASYLGDVSGPAVIVANLPYSIATPLLVNWIMSEPWPPWYDSLTLMFQKEVGERITAAAGSKSYGRLGILAQWRTEPALVMRLPARVFTPPPKVESVLVRFVPRITPIDAGPAGTLSRVTAAAFGQRRKMLRSSLKILVPDVVAWAQACGIDPSVRAEQVSVADFCKLSASLQAFT